MNLDNTGEDINKLKGLHIMRNNEKVKKIESQLKALQLYPKLFYIILMIPVGATAFIDVGMFLPWQNIAIVILALFASQEITSSKRTELLKNLMYLKFENDKDV